MGMSRVNMKTYGTHGLEWEMSQSGWETPIIARPVVQNIMSYPMSSNSVESVFCVFHVIPFKTPVPNQVISRPLLLVLFAAQWLRDS